MARRKTRRKTGGGSAGSWITVLVLGVTAAVVVVFASSALWHDQGSLPAPPDSPGASRAEATPAAPGSAGIRVEVWNGSGRSGAGQQVAGVLRDHGIVVTEVRNADRQDYGTTLVLDRKGNAHILKEVVDCLHGGTPLLMRSPGSAVDVRVVVGRDLEGLKLTP